MRGILRPWDPNVNKSNRIKLCDPAGIRAHNTIPKPLSNPKGKRAKRVSELSRRWNTILPSLLATYEKLQKLGFTYCDGKVTVIIPDLNGKKEDHE